LSCSPPSHPRRDTRTRVCTKGRVLRDDEKNEHVVYMLVSLSRRDGVWRRCIRDIVCVNTRFRYDLIPRQTFSNNRLVRVQRRRRPGFPNFRKATLIRRFIELSGDVTQSVVFRPVSYARLTIGKTNRFLRFLFRRFTKCMPRREETTTQCI